MSGRVGAVILDSKPFWILDTSAYFGFAQYKPLSASFGFWIGGANFAFFSRITELGIADGMDKICGVDEYVVWRWGKIGMILGST